jgi:hypothetical protein
VIEPTVDMYEAACRQLWHHRGRAWEALALVDELLAVVESAGGSPQVPEWRARAAEIRQSAFPGHSTPDEVEAAGDAMLADPAMPGRRRPLDVEVNAMPERWRANEPDRTESRLAHRRGEEAAPAGLPAPVYRLPFVHREQRDAPPDGTKES